MGIDLTERAANIKRKRRSQLNLENRQAVLGNSANVVADPNLPGNVLVRVQSSNGLLDNRSVRAPSASMPLTPGTPVKLKRDYLGRLQVDEQDNDLLLATGVDPVGLAIAQHSSSSPQANFETFRCIPDEVPSTVVNVKAAIFIVNGIAYQFAGASIDLGPSGANVIPGAGLKARIVVALTNDYSTLEAATSTPRGATDVPLNTEDLNEALALLSAGSVPSWYIDLADAQGTITVSDVLADGDLRNMINLPFFGTMSAFNVAGDSGTPQSIADANTLTIAGGTGLSSAASATDTITLNLDNTAVTPATYRLANVTFDQQGRATAASAGSVRVALTAQTASISATNVVTPGSDGEYLVTVVLTDTTASVSGGAVVASILYNDENGAQSQSTPSVLLSALGQANSIFTFHAKTTAAIQYSTTVSGVIVGSPQYSLYVNAVRIS